MNQALNSSEMRANPLGFALRTFARASSVISSTKVRRQLGAWGRVGGPSASSSRGNFFLALRSFHLFSFTSYSSLSPSCCLVSSRNVFQSVACRSLAQVVAKSKTGLFMVPGSATNPDHNRGILATPISPLGHDFGQWLRPGEPKGDRDKIWRTGECFSSLTDKSL